MDFLAFYGTQALPPPTLETLGIAKSIPQSYLWILQDSGHSTLFTYHGDLNKIVVTV